MIENIPSFEKKEIGKETAPPLNEIASALLNDAEIARLPENEQGKVIIDRFIGSLVRHGDVMSSNAEIGAMSPAHILSLMDKIGTTDEHGGLRTVQELTRTDGLRGSASLLAEDARTGALFGKLRQQLKAEQSANGKETLTLSTEAQVEGYIEAGGDRNNKQNAGQYEDPQAWIGPVMADFAAVAGGNSEWISTQQLSADIRDRDAITPEAYKREKELYEARSDAYFAGVDTELIRRSAEYMRQRDEGVKKELGERGIYLVTGGVAQRYVDNHDAWFQRHLGR